MMPLTYTKERSVVGSMMCCLLLTVIHGSQLHEHVKTKTQSEQLIKTGKPDKSRTTASITEFKDKLKSSKGSGME